MVSSRPSCDPPLDERYRELFSISGNNHKHRSCNPKHEIVECALPLIDLGGLRSHNKEARLTCVAEIAKASSEWGFFQVLNHGISCELLGEMKREQEKVFRLPFEKKASSGIWDGAYRWGSPAATCLNQFSWSEAFHVPLAKISEEDSLLFHTVDFDAIQKINQTSSFQTSVHPKLVM